MSRCYKCCKHFTEGINYCDKYKEIIHISKYGLLLHPFDSLSVYYKSDGNDLHRLINLAEKFLNDKTSESICTKYRKNRKISFSQQKLLTYKLLHCYEEKEVQEYIDYDWFTAQVE